MKFENLKAGETYWDVGRTKMGNTRITTVRVWPVRVIEIHPGSQTILASWNGNSPGVMSRRKWSKLRAKRPELESNLFGAMRIKRKVKP